jgi:hypothetical protein
LRGDVHLVELDLLRRGPRLPTVEPLPRANYFAFISRGDHRPECQVFHWSTREPLPTIAIPLRTPDYDIACELNSIFATTYNRGRFGHVLAYDRKPVVPLEPGDLEWARSVIGHGAQ